MYIPYKYWMPPITFITEYTEISEINSTVGMCHNLNQVPLPYSVIPTVVMAVSMSSVYLLALLSHLFLTFYTLPPSKMCVCPPVLPKRFPQ
jgi:hypothetical protein